jgi:hypothetical protein
LGLIGPRVLLLRERFRGRCLVSFFEPLRESFRCKAEQFEHQLSPR